MIIARILNFCCCFSSFFGDAQLFIFVHLSPTRESNRSWKSSQSLHPFGIDSINTGSYSRTLPWQCSIYIHVLPMRVTFYVCCYCMILSKNTVHWFCARQLRTNLHFALSFFSFFKVFHNHVLFCTFKSSLSIIYTLIYTTLHEFLQNYLHEAFR